MIRSELAVLQKRGKEVTEEELIQIALKQHWYEEEKGTPLKYIGKLVESFGLKVERRFCREINELFRELEQGHLMSLLVSMVVS